MKTFRPLPTLFLIGVLLPGAIAAQSPASRDSEALAVLGRMAAASGWTQLTVPVDVVATGVSVRHYGDNRSPMNVTLKAKGFRRYRTEVQDGISVSTTVVNGDRAAVLTSSGAQFFPPHAVLSMRPLTFPFLSELSTLADGDVTLRYVGTETVWGELTHRIEIGRQPAADDPWGVSRALASRITVWVSANTWLPVQIQHLRVPPGNPRLAKPFLRHLSDYRVVGGLLVPFRQEEFAKGTPIYTLQLNQVLVNVGLSDAEFALPGGQQ